MPFSVFQTPSSSSTYPGQRLRAVNQVNTIDKEPWEHFSIPGGFMSDKDDAPTHYSQNYSSGNDAKPSGRTPDPTRARRGDRTTLWDEPTTEPITKSTRLPGAWADYDDATKANVRKSVEFYVNSPDRRYGQNPRAGQKLQEERAMLFKKHPGTMNSCLLARVEMGEVTGKQTNQESAAVNAFSGAYPTIGAAPNDDVLMQRIGRVGPGQEVRRKRKSFWRSLCCFGGYDGW